MTQELSLATCTRCGRNRRMKFMIERKNRRGIPIWRCRSRSVCASIGRRKRAMVTLRDV